MSLNVKNMNNTNNNVTVVVDVVDVPESDKKGDVVNASTTTNSNKGLLSSSSPKSSPPKDLIRGVNIGGWLVLERYITPYQFIINKCHLNGDFCWYKGSLSAPSSSSSATAEEDAKECSKECTDQPVLMSNVYNSTDYPIDEYHLSKAFQDDPDIGAKWLNYHFDNFVSKNDLIQIKEAGITHVRVPLPHWILGDDYYKYNHDNDDEHNHKHNHKHEKEPWIVGDRWMYFQRFVGWCRELGIQVWPNIHTAPGSQNGFDNSGKQNSIKTCGGWNDDPKHIQQSLRVIDSITSKIVKDGMDDVITGFGLLNEPFGDCNITKYKTFMNDGLDIVRRNMGTNVSVFVSDLFSASRFGDGKWWLDPKKYSNTYLDSHYYSLFDQSDRLLSPKEHIESLCDAEQGSGGTITDCCWEDAPFTNSTPSHGVGRIVAEWSVAYDAMPGELLKVIIEGIRKDGVATLMDRQLSDERKEFLHNFAQAQIVSYEQAAVPGLSHGWFFWSLKMEGGAFIEWDFLRAIQKEGWFPKIQPPNVYSEDVYGSCNDILNRTVDDRSIVHSYPETGNDTYWDQYGLKYEFEAELENATVTVGANDDDDDDNAFGFSVGRADETRRRSGIMAVSAMIMIIILFVCMRFKRCQNGHRKGYTEITNEDNTTGVSSKV